MDGTRWAAINSRKARYGICNSSAPRRTESLWVQTPSNVRVMFLTLFMVQFPCRLCKRGNFFVGKELVPGCYIIFLKSVFRVLWLHDVLSHYFHAHLEYQTVSCVRDRSGQNNGQSSQR